MCTWNAIRNKSRSLATKRDYASVEAAAVSISSENSRKNLLLSALTAFLLKGYVSLAENFVSGFQWECWTIDSGAAVISASA